MGVDLDRWLEKVRRCEYLAEDELKALCEYVSCLIVAWVDCTHRTGKCCVERQNAVQVKEILVEESNVQPVNSPVTVSLVLIAIGI